MTTKPSLRSALCLLLAAIVAMLVCASCEPARSGPSNIPWNQQEAWEGTARYGNFPQSH